MEGWWKFGAFALWTLVNAVSGIVAGKIAYRCNHRVVGWCICGLLFGPITVVLMFLFPLLPRGHKEIIT